MDMLKNKIRYKGMCVLCYSTYSHTGTMFGRFTKNSAVNTMPLTAESTAYLLMLRLSNFVGFCEIEKCPLCL